MRHGYFGKKLSRNTNERKQLLRNLVRDVFLHGKITTTQTKAHAIQGMIDKLITKAKIGTDVKRKEIMAVLPHKDAVTLLWKDAQKRFSARTSGYTRIIKLGRQHGDGAQKVILSFVDAAIEEVKPAVSVEQPKKIAQTKEVKTPVKKTVKTKKTT